MCSEVKWDSSVIKVFHLIYAKVWFHFVAVSNRKHWFSAPSAADSGLSWGGGDIFVGKGQLGGMEYPPREMEGKYLKYRCKMFSYAVI